MCATLPRGGVVLRWGSDQRKGNAIDGRGIVAQANINRFADRARNGKAGVSEAVGDRRGCGEVGIGADRVEQEKFVSNQRAGLIGAWAANFLQHGNAHKIDKGLPIAFDAVRTDGAELEATEGRGSELTQWIKDAEDGVRVLKNEVAVGNAQRSVKRLVGGSDFNFFSDREALRRFCFKREVETRILRQLFRVIDM